ncbi:superoxide dismutase family protein [Croceicoccus ponticola]|uniref:Superoxide dismutase family protein n=1 Tax=Croceicoccus ponticola TaxID=2217664 RepID=A0A437H1B0_9SPHN|nr:superoxide dismutase family protein [Croceicoccus ponticola]RVQ69302.1 superoxide dismutase family protein [Croceicoccus ponticola]
MKLISAKASVFAMMAPFALSACGEVADHAVEATPAPEMFENPAAQSAIAELKDVAGNVVGMVTVTGNDGALAVKVIANNLPKGLHGAHIHATGDCSAADFTSAGGHWNPNATNHGLDSAPPHPHAGDTGNIEIGEDGTGTLTGTSDGTWAALFDADGSAFVVHAAPDDMKSQPAGNAGARIACGVFVAG